MPDFIGLSSYSGPRPRTLIRISIWPRHLEHGVLADLEIIALATRAHDGTGERRLIHAVLDHGLVDMDGNDLPEREPGVGLLAVGALQLNDLSQLAFERYRAFGNPWHIDELAGNSRQACDRELVDLVSDMRGGRVHLLCQILGRKIPDELAGLLDIGDAVLPGGRGKADDRRHVTEAVEEAVRRQIDVAFGVSRGNPADRTRRDDGIERVVLEAMAVLGLVKVQVFFGHAGIILSNAVIPGPRVSRPRNGNIRAKSAEGYFRTESPTSMKSIICSISACGLGKLIA